MRSDVRSAAQLPAIGSAAACGRSSPMQGRAWHPVPGLSAPAALAAGSILDPIYTVLGTLLTWFYAVVPSYMVAIILLTVAVRLILFPLTAKQAKSMQAMQRVQPELKRLQQKYKNDRQKLNEEMMKFYKEHQINPLAGCLPLVLQLPLFFVLYRVIRGLTHTLLVGALVLGGTGVGHAVSGAKVRCDGPATGSAETTGPCRISGARVAGGTVVDAPL